MEDLEKEIVSILNSYRNQDSTEDGLQPLDCFVFDAYFNDIAKDIIKLVADKNREDEIV
jgi:hypothetical protein